MPYIQTQSTSNTLLQKIAIFHSHIFTKNHTNSNSIQIYAHSQKVDKNNNKFPQMIMCISHI